MHRSPHTIALLGAYLAASCSSPTPPISDDAPVTAASPATSDRREAIARDVQQAIDTGANPCEDFYQYACGGWFSQTERPADKARWVRSFDVIRKQNTQRLRELLDRPDAQNGGAGALSRAFWRACMDTQAIEAQGISPLTRALAPIEAIDDTQALMTQVASLHQAQLSPLFRLYVSPDAKQPEVNLAILSQAGLGLPDRAMYLEPVHAELLRDYTQHIARMLTLTGTPETEANAQAGAIAALETELAAISLPRHELRDPDKTYNKMDRAALMALAPALPWQTYLDALSLSEADELNVATPSYFRDLSALIERTPIEVLRAYVRWNMVRASGGWLTEAIDQAHFDFYGKRLNNLEQREPRWERCVDATDSAVGFDLGQLYVEEFFAGDSKRIANEMVAQIKEAFAARLPEIDWMDEQTRARAADKLATFYPKLGYPESWRDYASLSIGPDTPYFEAQKAARSFEFSRRVAEYGQPVDLSQWYMTPPVVNAYYTPFGNQIVFPAGILQPPFFDRDFPAAMNFGGIGMVIGHEMTHGFDDKGRKFGPDGRLEPWWTPEAIARFEQRAECVEQHYASIEVQPSQRINGKLTLGENIADIGGLGFAWRGYQRWRAKQPQPQPALVDGLTQDQLFFVSFAQSWCSLTTPENERVRLLNDSHSPPRWRVNATLAHTPAFHEAFSCEEEAPMRAKNSCEIW